MAKASRWLKLFEDFIVDLRISSKEEVSEDERGVKLNLWDSQKIFLRELCIGLDQGVRIFNCLKSRQLGITTVSLAIDVFWLAMHNNLKGALVTDNEKNKNENRAIIRHYVASFPEDYFGEKFTIVQDNRDCIEFSNGSRLNLLVAGVKKKGVSWAEGAGYAFCHLTEVSKYGDADALISFFESFAQTNPNRLCICESTANGPNHWQTRWLNGKQNPLTERSFFIGWWAAANNVITRADPRFSQFGTYKPLQDEREQINAVASLYGHKITIEQLAWYRWKQTQAQTGTDMLDQNQPFTERQAFVQMGYSFFQTRQVAKELKHIESNPDAYGYQGYRYDFGSTFFDTHMVEVEDPDDVELKIWEEPIDGAHYVIGADPAWGRNENRDRHALVVFRCFADKLVQVAEFATADIEVRFFAWVMAHIAGAYVDCVVIHDINGPGKMIFGEWDHLRGLMQSELYGTQVRKNKWEDFLSNARWYLYNRPDSLGRGYALGFETQFRSKPPLMHQMRGAYVTQEIIIKSMRALEEMLIVTADGDDIGAPESHNEDAKDDRVFAIAYAVEAWIKWRRADLLSQGVSYDVAMKMQNGQLTPQTRGINSQVYRFFANAQEQQVEPDHRPKWLVQRGLQ